MIPNKDDVIEEVVTQIIEQSDIEPGELNRKLGKVATLTENVQEEFDDVIRLTHRLQNNAQNLDSSSRELAEAGVEMAKASQDIGEAVDDFGDEISDLTEAVEDLNSTLDRIDSVVPDEERYEELTEEN